MAPFYTDQGYLHTSQIKTEESGEPVTSQIAASHKFKFKLNEITQKLKSTITSSNSTMKYFDDVNHKNIKFLVGDWVILKTVHLKTIRPCKKHNKKFIGPFKVTEKITNKTNRLDLKNLVGKRNDILHVEKLEKFRKS